MVAASPSAPDPPRQVAFLRGINLGNRRLGMDELRARFEELGLDRVATFLASGNVVFDHSGEDLPGLERSIEEHLEEALGYGVRTFVRPLAGLARLPGLEVVVGRAEDLNPHVIFVRDRVAKSTVSALEALESDDDRFHPLEREIVWLRRGRMTDAAFSTRDLDAALGGRDHSMRNLNTVRRIVAKFGEADE